MPDRNNRRRGRAWRELIALFLQGQGIELAEARPSHTRRKMSESWDDPIQPDISGVPGGWFLETHSDLSAQFGTSLDSAESSAALAGFKKAAVIQYRREANVSQAFVLMSLDQFTSGVLQRDLADWQSLQEFEKWALAQEVTDE